MNIIIMTLFANAYTRPTNGRCRLLFSGLLVSGASHATIGQYVRTASEPRFDSLPFNPTLCMPVRMVP